MKNLILIFLIAVIGAEVAIGTSWSPRNLKEKVQEAGLIVEGVASLEGERTLVDEHEEYGNSYSQDCRIKVKRVLWSKDVAVTNDIVLPIDISTNFPGSWWNYNNTTGIFFFVKTEILYTQMLEDHKKMYSESPSEEDKKSLRAHIYKAYSDTTKQWSGLERFDDWYEPATNVSQTIKLIKQLRYQPQQKAIK